MIGIAGNFSRTARSAGGHDPAKDRERGTRAIEGMSDV